MTRFFHAEQSARDFCEALHAQRMTLAHYAAEFKAGRIDRDMPVFSPTRGWIVSYCGK